MGKDNERSSMATSPTLLEHLKQEDSQAWVRLVECYSPKLAKLCLTRGLDSSATQDVLQETWVSVGKSLSKFSSPPGRGSFRAWLRRILLRRISDHRRASAHQPLASGGNSLFGCLPSEFRTDSISSDESRSHIRLSLQGTLTDDLLKNIDLIRGSVDEKTWTIFERSVIDGISTELVASEFSITAANVRQIRSRILRKLRKSVS